MDSNHRSLVSKTSGLSQAFPHSAIAPFEIHSHKVGISKYLFCEKQRRIIKKAVLTSSANFYNVSSKGDRDIYAYYIKNNKQSKCMVKKLAKFGLHCFPIMRYRASKVKLNKALNKRFLWKPLCPKKLDPNMQSTYFCIRSTIDRFEHAMLASHAIFLIKRFKHASNREFVQPIARFVHRLNRMPQSNEERKPEQSTEQNILEKTLMLHCRTYSA